MKGEDAEQQFDKLAKSNLKITVDEARDTEGSTGQENKRLVSGAFVVCGQRREMISEKVSKATNE